MKQRDAKRYLSASCLSAQSRLPERKGQLAITGQLARNLMNRRQASPHYRREADGASGSQIVLSRKSPFRNGVHFTRSSLGVHFAPSSHGAEPAFETTESMNCCTSGMPRTAGQISCARSTYCMAFSPSPTRRRPPASFRSRAASSMVSCLYACVSGTGSSEVGQPKPPCPTSLLQLRLWP